MMRAVLGVLLLAAISGAAQGSTHLVAPDGSGDFPTIQAAVDGANDGDVIELADGVFTGAGNRDISYSGKAITIRSASGNAEACFIDCQGTPEEPHCGFIFASGEGPGSILEAISVRNGDGGELGPGAVLCEEGSSPEILRCVFSSNRAVSGGAISSRRASPSIRECSFRGNTAENGGAIILCWGSTPSLTECDFSENEAVYGGAIYT